MPMDAPAEAKPYYHPSHQEILETNMSEHRASDVTNARLKLFPDANIVSEGFFFGPNGGVVNTIYMDLSGAFDYGMKTLAKYGKPEHHLSSHNTIRLSRARLFRDIDDGLIGDTREGVVELSGETGDAGKIYFGDDTLVYCVSVWPEDNEIGTLKDSFPDEYTSVSRIFRPRQFAQAIGLGLCEQVGAHGQRQPFNDKFDGFGRRKYVRKSMMVIHGPVLYSDHKARFVLEAETPLHRLSASLLVKPVSHKVQKEYRYVAAEMPKEIGDTFDLPISGMMLDCLKPIRNINSEEKEPLKVELVPDGGTSS